ncbi:MAG: LLM class F420-dependent oxidoreductase, partial [Chloroflexi bacterium RBG_16_68_14]
LEAKLQRLEDLVQQVVDAEREGFDSFWFVQIFGADPLTAIAVAGMRTERIELGVCVVPTYPRHPFALAQQALTVQAATGGRLTLGIGPSHKLVIENMLGLSYDQPASHVREYLSVLRPLVNEGRVAFSGQHFRVAGGLGVPGATPFPILISALAPMMLRVAGELADGTVTWMTGPRTLKDHVVPRINAAAEAAGRPRPRVCAGLPVCVTDDAGQARERAGQEFQVYGQLPNYRRMLDREGAAGPADIAIVGNEEQVEAQVRAFAAAGATDLAASIFPAGGDEAASLARTRAFLRGLVGKV